MAWTLRPPCKYKGCALIAERGSSWCSVHSEYGKQQDADKREQWKERKLATDPQERALRAFYKSSTWRKLRLLQLHEHPLCAQCGKAGTMVDHKVRIKDGGERLEMNNLQTLCDPCHASKRGREAHEGKRD